MSFEHENTIGSITMYGRTFEVDWHWENPDDHSEGRSDWSASLFENGVEVPIESICDFTKESDVMIAAIRIIETLVLLGSGE